MGSAPSTSTAQSRPTSPAPPRWSRAWPRRRHTQRPAQQQHRSMAAARDGATLPGATATATAHSAATSATTHSLTGMPERYGTVRGELWPNLVGLAFASTRRTRYDSAPRSCLNRPALRGRAECRDRMTASYRSEPAPNGVSSPIRWLFLGVRPFMRLDSRTRIERLGGAQRSCGSASRSQVVAVTPRSWSRCFSTFSVGVRGSASTTSM